ncbi:NaeI family type II restriction endonuclease [Streptomyces sp. NPDC048295]|uniref:NaeI family type II restriction endonuclease n=1 Tax=Streptomyces sp. NPDC048295 TaxID=3154617 RepID=UPI00341A29B4
MSARLRGKDGRPPGLPYGANDAEDLLVLFLRGLRDAAGLSVERIHLQLPDMVGDKPKPAPSTLHRVLRGKGLRNRQGLVKALIEICVPDPIEAAKAHRRAHALLKKAWEQPGRAEADQGQGDGKDWSAHLAKLVHVQEQLLDTQAALDLALQAKKQAEAKLDAHSSSREEEIAELRRGLLAVTGERDAALRFVQEATQRITGLERKLAAVGTNPTPGRKAEQWQGTESIPSVTHGVDEVAMVRDELLGLDPSGRRMTAVLEHATERLLDGELTGRFRWEELTQSEKAMAGQLIENLMRHDFRFDTRGPLDFRIAGVDVELKVTSSSTWTIPREAQGRVCMLVHLDHRRGLWSLGVVRATEELLRSGANKDGKRNLSRAGHEAIEWIHKDSRLPVNVLNRLPAADLQAILAQTTGQGRVNELFRAAQRQSVTLPVLATVARQRDAAKRARDARRILAAEGILVLNHRNSDPEIARALGLPVPEKGTWVSVRLALATQEERGTGRSVVLSGTWWRLAKPDDEVSPLPGH